MSETLKDRILKTLIDSHQLKKEQVEEAIALQKSKGISLDKALLEKGLINEKDLLMLLVRELNIPFINLSKYKIDPSLKEIIPERIARLYKIVPLSSLERTVTIALSDPLNVFVMDDIKNVTGKDVDVVMSTNTEIQKAIDNFYGAAKSASVNEITKEIQLEDFEIVSEQDQKDDSDAMVDESEKAPIVRMVNLILKEAIRMRASDIHMEPMADAMRVRLRVDGVLIDTMKVPKDSQNSIVTRIKILSRMDITVNYTPQDGRFKMKIGENYFDFRVSILPTTFGAKVVMRILDKANLSIGLDGLGFSPKTMAIFKEGIAKPFGMILVTGPTGSGKSTTLYSIVNQLNTVERNIITIEDPVEYLVDGLTQIQARPEIGLTFAEGLRSVLRQSPDIVMVGEIRDSETADIAIKASLTGQLVLSTLHTNDAPGALTRLIDMGVEPFLVASSLVQVSAQRLCRKVCQNCKEKVKIPDEVLERIDHKFKKDVVFYQGKGCEACRKTGYKGRVSICEVMEVDDDIRTKLLEGATSDQIKQFARTKKGMDTLWDDAILKCESGITTLEEILRVTTNE
jgi:type IV pilus assembly protein PilB